MVKISVLMPVYKTHEAYLREAIESVLNQTFTDFEFLILDDCPTDSREEIVKSYTDPRIVYLKNEQNLGITPSRNRLVKMAKGEYLAVIDHDDIALPTRFEEQVRILDAHPEIGVCGGFTEEFPKTRIVNYPVTSHEIETYLMQGCAISHTSAMIRAAILPPNPYEEAFSPSEDYALWCRLIGKTEFHNIPKVLMKYRLYEGNTSKAQHDKMDRATEAIHAFVREAHPQILEELRTQQRCIIRMRLFGLIPIGQFEQQGSLRRGILKYLPFITIKAKIKK